MIEEKINLSSTFGMFEMEQAAARIVRICLKIGTWVVPITYSSMEGDTEEKGYLHLIYGDMIKNHYNKGNFYVTPEFVERVKKLSIVTPLGDAPTWQEIQDHESGGDSLGMGRPDRTAKYLAHWAEIAKRRPDPKDTQRMNWLAGDPVRFLETYHRIRQGESLREAIDFLSLVFEKK